MMKKYVLSGAKSLFLCRVLFSALFLFLSFKGWGQANLPVSTTTLDRDNLPTGFSHLGLGTNYSGPSLKFDTQGDYLVLYFNGVAETLTFELGVNGTFPGTIPSSATFSVQWSSDGINYANLNTYSNIGGGVKTISSLNSSAHYIRWIYTTKPTGTNVALKNINLVSPSCAAPTVSLQTTPVQNISSSGADLYGDVTATGDAALNTRGFEYSTSSALASPTVVNEPATATGNYDLATGTLVPNTLYYYRAYAINDCATPQTGYSHTSGYPTFTTIHNAPNVGTGSAPTSHGFTANWSAPSGTAGSENFTYEIQVSTDNTFASVDFTQSNIASSSTSLVINNAALTSSTTYYYKVRANNAGGSSAWSNVSAGITTDVATFSSVKNGDWNTANTWDLNSVPSQNDKVIINHIVSTATGITRNASTTVNGTFQLNSGGYVTGGSTKFTYNQTTGTLNFKTNGIYDVNNNDAYWPVTDGPINVNVLREATDATGSDSGFRLNSANRTIPTNGTLSISGYNGTNYTGIFLNSSTLYINGKISIKPFGFVGNTPVYGNASTLEYNNVSSFTVGNEWTANSTTAGAGVPQNVTLVNNASINMPTGNRGIAGNLTIASGSTLILNGSNGDLYIAGNCNNGGTFNPNSRAVFFNGSTNQTITGTTAFDYLFIDNASNVTLASSISINNNTNSKIDFINGKLILGANNLTLDGNAYVAGASASRYMVTNGAGRLIQNVGNSEREFPVGFTTTNYTPLKVTNTSGTSELGVSVKQSITNAVNDPNKIVNLEWNVNSTAVTTAVITPVWEAATPINQAAGFNNTGSGELGNFTAGYQIYAVTLATNTTTASSVNLVNGNNYIVVGNTNAILPASNTSDIILQSAFTYTENIPYISYQAASPLTSATGNVAVMGLTIRDGGGSADTDNLPTIVTGITFNNITGTSMLRSAALFDESNNVVANGTINSGSNTIAFTGLNYSVNDNANRSLTLRVSFNATGITDNTKLLFSVAKANVSTALAATSSQMSNFTTITSDNVTTNDKNRIEVTADRIAFNPQPTDGSKDVALSPFVIKAVDANANTDLDAVNSVTFTTSGTGMSASNPYTLSAGAVTIGDVVFSIAPQTGITITATTTGLANNTVTSDPFNIDTDPAIAGDYRTISDGNWNVDAIWQKKNASGGWDATTYPFAGIGVTLSNSIFIKNTVNFNLSQQAVYTNVTVNSGATLNNNNTNSFNIASGGKLLIKSGGKYYNNKITTVRSGATLEVEDHSYFYNSYSSKPLAENLFLGTEIFHPNSNFVVIDAISPDSGTSAFITDFTVLTPFDDGNGNIGYFGNIIYESLGNSVSLVYGKGSTTGAVSTNYNICNGDLIFNSGTATARLVYLNNTDTASTASTSTRPYKIGGSLIIENDYTGSVYVRQTRVVSTYFKVGKNIELNGNSTFNIGNINAGIYLYVDGDINVKDTSKFYFVPSSSVTSTYSVYLKGDVDVASGAFFTNLNTNSTAGAPNASLFFTGAGDGTTPELTQTVNISSAVARVDFNLKHPTIGGTPYVKLLNNLTLDNKSTVDVRKGATLDFGFTTSNDPFIITNSGNNTTFSSQSGAILKITSPDGIASAGSTGNVQVPTRTYDPAGIYHYIGKANQSTGNGLPGGTATAGTDIKVIADLDDSSPLLPYDDRLTLTVNGMINLNNAGELEIRRGTVLDSPSNGFTDASGQNAKLTMSNGRYKIFRTSGSTQPALGGAYTLTGGVIEFAGDGKFNVKTNKDYLNVEVTATDVTAGTTETAGLSFLANGTFKVMNGGVFKVNNPDGFSGSSSTAIRQDNTPTITLEDGSAVEYSRSGDQLITAQSNVGQGTANYANLNISGSGIKAPADNLEVNDKITVNAGELKIKSTQDNITSTDHHVPNVLWAHKGIINNGGIVTLENNAQLMQDDSGVTNSGMVNVQRKNTIPSSTFAQYVYWSSPVVPASNEVDKFFTKIFSGYTAAATYYSETNDHFYASSGKYIVGRGLAVKNPVYGTPPSPNFVMAELKGTPFNGPATFSMTMTGRGFNLVGNPYPTNLSLQELYLLNGGDATATSEGGTIDPTFHLWDNVNNPDDVQEGSAYGGASYAIFNAKGTGTFTPANSSIKTFDGAVVSIGQGFMVKAIKADNKILTFNNTVRKPEKGIFFKSAVSNIDLGKYWLRLTNASSGFSTIAVTYSQGASNALESFDSKVANRGGDMFYSYVNDNKLAIQGRAYDFTTSDVVPLGMAHSQEGNYTISVWKKQGIFDGQQKIYLRDKNLGTVTDISEGSYSFQSTSGEFTNRFEIVYEPQTTLGTTGATKGDIIVYRDGNDFVIKSSLVNIQEVELYEVSGKLTRGLHGNAKELRFPTSKFANGVYILKIRLQNGSVVTRKIIQ